MLKELLEKEEKKKAKGEDLYWYPEIACNKGIDYKNKKWKKVTGESSRIRKAKSASVTYLERFLKKIK